jgi:hypothetical protein
MPQRGCWAIGDCLWRWQHLAALHPDLGDGEHAEVVMDGRAYRVRIGELR